MWGGRRRGGTTHGDTTCCPTLLGDTTLKGETTRARGDDTEGGHHIRCHHPLWCPRMVIPPLHRPPSPALSPPSVWCLPGGWDNMWYPHASSPPLRRPPSPVSSPPSVWCLPGGWDNMWYPRASSPPPRRPSLAHVLSRSSVVSPRSLWCPRASSPLARHPPLLRCPPSVLSPLCGVPVHRPPLQFGRLPGLRCPPLWCPHASSPPPHRPPLLPTLSPPSVWCLPGGWDNMWCPRASSPLCVSSPLTRVVPPSVVSPGVVGPHVVPPSASSPPTAPPLCCPPSAPCVVPPCHPPLLCPNPLTISLFQVKLMAGQTGKNWAE